MLFDLLYGPDVVGLQQFLEVVVLLLGADLSELSVNGIVVGGSIDVADDTEGYGEAVAITHQGELQLQGVVLAVGIVNEYVVDGVAVLANLDNLQAEALLYETELVVLTKDELLAVLDIDSILLTALLIIYGLVAAIVEDDAVLQYLGYAGTLVLVGSLQYLNSSLCISSYTTCKEVSTGTEAEFGRAEGILNGSVG